MKVIPMRDYPQDVADNFLSGINFVREMRLNDPDQFGLLMERTQFVELSPDETIINAGEMDSRYFFLLKGQLSVYADSEHCHRGDYTGLQRRVTDRHRSGWPGAIAGFLCVFPDYQALVVQNSRQ